MQVNLTETSFMNDVMVQNRLGSDMSHWLVQTPDVMVITNTYIKGMADTLAVVKKKDHPVMIRMNDPSGKFLVAMIAEYIVNEEDSEKNHWLVSMTFDEKDTTDITEVYDNTHTKVQSITNQVGLRDYNVEFRHPNAFQEMITIIFRSLLALLDDNANASEQFTVVSDLFTASVEVDNNGNIVKSIIPGDEIKKKVAKTITD